MPIPYTNKVNKRLLGSEQAIFSELHTIGITGLNTVTPDEIRLLEVPLKESPSSVVVPGLTEVLTTPGTNEFKVDYTNGRILFHPSRNGQFVNVDYKGRGSIIDAEDINEVQQPLASIANLDGTLTDEIVTPQTISQAPTDDFTFPNDVTVEGDLTVNGTVTALNSETVTIEDNIILLNSNVTGSPTLDSGLEVERGTDTNVRMIWDETSDSWKFTGTTGATLFEIPDSGLVAVGSGISSPGSLTYDIDSDNDSTSEIHLWQTNGSLELMRLSEAGDLRVTGRIGVNIDPIAELHNDGSTVLGLVTDTDPASIPVGTVDAKTGIVIDTTGAVSVTLPSPTNTTLGRFFTVLHKATATGTLSVNGSNIGVGKGSTFMWDGSDWVPVGATGGFEVVSGDPASPVAADVWFDTTTNQFKGYNGSDIVILG